LQRADVVEVRRRRIGLAICLVLFQRDLEQARVLGPDRVSGLGGRPLRLGIAQDPVCAATANRPCPGSSGWHSGGVDGVNCRFGNPVPDRQCLRRTSDLVGAPSGTSSGPGALIIAIDTTREKSTGNISSKPRQPLGWRGFDERMIRKSVQRFSNKIMRKTKG
jgi:hypothetical protein